MRWITLILILCAFELYAADINYESVFGNDYKSAAHTIAGLSPDIRKECARFNADSDIAMATVFPELIRESILRDKIESCGLYFLYINYGKPYADFSAGIFQMKPSFFEALERLTNEDDDYSIFSTIFSYPAGLQEKDIRKERVKRINSIEWQCRYLAFFMHVISRKFPVDRMDEAARVRFYSAAYNCGFLKKSDDIIQSMKREQFPYGKGIPFHQYSYSSVSLWYYTHSIKIQNCSQ